MNDEVCRLGQQVGVSQPEAQHCSPSILDWSEDAAAVGAGYGRAVFLHAICVHACGSRSSRMGTIPYLSLHGGCKFVCVL